ncbi:MAG: enoyl-CoA hydratase-related protein [Chloroflexota bacterium]|nr:enoyl-CoA hydratase-related protein [Chloroflexota bacterium]
MSINENEIVSDNSNEQNDILVEHDGGVATVIFNRPTQRNAISYAGWLELQRIAIDLERDDSVRVVVFTGAGDRAFSAGADIKDFEQYRINSQIAKVYAAAFDGAMDAVEAMSKPTISMIRGFCVGGGCEFSMATDIRIASDDSRFGIPIARLGILVGYGEMRRLVQLVGPGNASYILLSGRLIDAHEAHRIGLITTLLGADELRDYTYALAREMAELAPLSHKRNKRIRDITLRNPSGEGLSQEEEDLPFTNFDSADFHEGRAAFIERRTPNFKGG